MPRIEFPNRGSLNELTVASYGVIADSYNPILSNNTASPATQVVTGILIGLRAGQTITGIKTRVAVAAAGTAPTTARFGIADSTGKILAVSGNVGAAASWPQATAAFPLSASYTIPSDGGYFACFVVNGTWGTTQPTLLKFGGGASNAALVADGSFAPPAFQWAAQTDLPAVNSSMTTTTGTANTFYLAFY